MAKKILLVEDETDLLKVLLFRLNHTGYEALGAADGREALGKARRMIPDMMILDVFLPLMRGDAVARIVKKDEKLKHIPIVLISADSKNLERRAREAGVEAFLAKPFESGALIDMVKKHIP